MSDDAKKLILARRARFVAAAVASVGIACGKEKATPPTPPEPCLSPTVAIEADAGAPPTPTPCLSVAYPPPDAAPPRPCLTMVAPRRDAGKKCDPNDPLCSE